MRPRQIADESVNANQVNSRVSFSMQANAPDMETPKNQKKIIKEKPPLAGGQ